MKQIEQWKKIKGYETLYQVSNFGRVQSLHSVKRLPGYILKGCLNYKGYHMAILCGGEAYELHYFVHRLVAEAFIPNPENKTQVNHIDGNKLNNNISNLEWATPQENMAHGFRTGLINNSGTNNGMAKLTDDKVRLIRHSTKTRKELRTIFKVSNYTIDSIRHNRAWKHIF